MNITFTKTLLSQIQDNYKVTGNQYVIKELEELKNYLDETRELKDKLSRRNMQIKDLKKRLLKAELFMLAYTPVKGQEKDYLNTISIVKTR